MTGYASGRRIVLLALCAALGTAAVLASGCYGPTQQQGERVHSETVDDQTYTQVRSAVQAAGLTIGDGDMLAYRVSDTRVRAEGSFTATDGTTYSTVSLERSGGSWTIIDKR